MRRRRLRKTKVRRLTVLAMATFGMALLHSDIAAAMDAKKLSGAEIRTKLSGMQLTDEVLHRLVYKRDGTLRSYSMGVKKVANGTSRRTSRAFISARPMTAVIGSR
jgi:hypothetical protein